MKPELSKEIAGLPEIPSRVAQAYKDRLGEMVEKVNIDMSSRADIRMLIGDNPMSMMFDNHNNHARFMSNVFLLNEYGLLVNTVPWVYRAYRHHGFAYEYFPVHLQVWQQVLKEFLGPDTAAPLVRVYEWMQSHHQDFIESAEQPARQSSEPAPEWRETYERFLKALLDPDRRACAELARTSVPSPDRLKEFYLNVVQPSMYAVGDKWEAGEISVAAEHLASALVNRVMSMQYVELMKDTESQKGKVAVTAAANEFHEIGPTMVANTLEADGWDVSYLGANTPPGEFLDFISSQEFDIVAVSASMPFNLEVIQDIIQEIRSWPEERQPKIMLGGLVFRDSPELAGKLGADGYALDCGQALELAEKWQKNKR